MGDRGASSQKSGAGAGAASVAAPVAAATKFETEKKAKASKKNETIKTMSINLDFGANESSKSIQSKLEKAATGTWIEINSSLSYQKSSKGTWNRVNTQTGASMGTVKTTSFTLAKTIYNRKHGY